nr:hypothetical protein [Burkholderia gladioli]
MEFFTFISSNFPAAATLCATAITGALGGIKLLTDRASKVTDFRKAWIETLREAAAEFSASTHTIAGRIAIRMKHGAPLKITEIQTPPQIASAHTRQITSEFNIRDPLPFDKEFETELLPHWSSLRLAYNTIILHLNPAEHTLYRELESNLSKLEKDYREAIHLHTKSWSREIENPENIKETMLRLLDRSIRNSLISCISEIDEISGKLANNIKKNKNEYVKIKISIDLTILRKRFIESGGKLINDDKNPLNLAPAKYAFNQDPVHFFEMQAPAPSAGSLLLLASFSTRQLLHGRYSQVYDDMESIELGIKTLDTAAAILIKHVWSEIKRGEPIYRATTYSSILIFAIVFIALLIGLLSGENQSSTRHTRTIHCSAEPTSTTSIDVKIPKPSSKLNSEAKTRPLSVDCTLTLNSP